MAVDFQKKKLGQTRRVCFLLKEAREDRGISLDQMSTRTRISKKYLQALEECRFENLPQASIYQKNFVKQYAEALELDPRPFLQQYTIEEIVKGKKKFTHPKHDIKTGYSEYLPHVIRYGMLILAVCVLGTYLIWQIHNILKPPSLILISPPDGYITNDSSVIIQGGTNKEVRVSINGKEVMSNENGEFREIINLQPGVNTIMVKAEKKHGKTTTETRYVVLKQ